MKKNKQLIQKGFDQWTNGSASFFDLLADDVTWTITGNSPIAKTYNSRQQFLDEAITPINERLSERIVPTLRALYADGDMVIALWDGKAIAKDATFLAIRSGDVAHSPWGPKPLAAAYRRGRQWREPFPRLFFFRPRTHHGRPDLRGPIIWSGARNMERDRVGIQARRCRTERRQVDQGQR